MRRLAFIGRLDDAERAFAALDADVLPPVAQAVQALIEAGIAMRRLRTGPVREALESASQAAMRSGIESLAVEVRQAKRTSSCSKRSKC